MKYFAKLDETNKVIAVHCLNDTEATTEENGINFLKQLHNYPYWKEASKDGSIRKNGAGIGMQYDSTKDAFIPPKDYPSWILDEDTCQWKAPIPYPETNTQNLMDKNGNPTNDIYYWNESTKSWVEVT
jgi:hypothetical protein|tara:strand:+ start:1065 stop:1448 length:384 start_codon:yes stop_codon:yes gene_type:complete